MKIQYIEDQTSIEIDNIYSRRLLVTLENYKIQRMYWRSKYDYNHIEYIEPKIYDAFIFCIDYIGKIPLEDLKQFNTDKNVYSYLERCCSLSQDEIKEYAGKMLSIL